MIPKISVIIPVYNVEKYLDRCVSSVLGQTLTELEIILVDDGSPDNCPQMCDEYKLKDGIGADRKKRATRYERIPTGWLGCLQLGEAGSLAALVPAGLPAEFTAAEFAKAARLRGRRASAALKALQALGAAELTGTLRGRARLYRCTVNSFLENEEPKTEQGE